MAKKRKTTSRGKKTARKGTKRRKAAKRELIKTGRDARFTGAQNLDDRSNSGTS